jgi:hypothetical protein
MPRLGGGRCRDRLCCNAPRRMQQHPGATAQLSLAERARDDPEWPHPGPDRRA